jgi:hypothetical protein
LTWQILHSLVEFQKEHVNFTAKHLIVYQTASQHEFKKGALLNSISIEVIVEAPNMRQLVNLFENAARDTESLIINFQNNVLSDFDFFCEWVSGHMNLKRIVFQNVVLCKEDCRMFKRALKTTKAPIVDIDLYMLKYDSSNTKIHMDAFVEKY